MKLLKVDTIKQAQEKLYNCIKDKAFDTETVTIAQATGRILSQDIVSSENIPDFYRSTVDGYAVKAVDTQGATETIPVFLKIIDDIEIGKQATSVIQNGQCAYVPTGGMLPIGADAMVMVEYTEIFDQNSVAVYDSVAFGKSVVVPGEDIEKGEKVLSKGTVLYSAQIGTLAALGMWQVEVFKPLKVTIISTGDEIVKASQKTLYGQVRDVNTWALKSMAQEYGMQVVKTIQIQDDQQLLKETLIESMQASDIVLTSGGSSQGKKDMTDDILNLVTDGGVFTHGLSIKPGKPTILAFDKQTKTVFVGLPGHPVAALTVFEILIADMWKNITQTNQKKPIIAVMENAITGADGKTTCMLVQIEKSKDENNYIARPILGKSGLINTMSKADGYIVIDMNKEGLKKGETVLVHRFGD